MSADRIVANKMRSASGAFVSLSMALQVNKKH
jgi:hypothetical protein